MQNKIKEVVSEIIVDVKENGDDAVRERTLKYDKVCLKAFEVESSEFDSAYKNVKRSVKEAFKFAANNIRKFAEEQYKQFTKFDIETIDGCRVGQKIVPLFY
jgi:histidinol dehydrogenase